MNKPRRAPRRRVNGVLLLDKPAGISSNAALQKARWLLNAEKAGHTGTLDPLATGLLPLCFGEATKFSGAMLDAGKDYIACVQLGVVTTTADAEGQVLETRPVTASCADVEALLPRFTGTIEQIPPMYSALKRAGVPLYSLARQGVEVDRAPRQVMIDTLQLLDWQTDRFTLRVACSKGTYVRTLATDLGEALGCGAHLAALRRTRVGNFDLSNAVSLAELETKTLPERDAMLQPSDTLLGRIQPVQLAAPLAECIMHGQPIRNHDLPPGRYRLFAANGFIGLGELGADGWLRPKRLVTASE